MCTITQRRQDIHCSNQEIKATHVQCYYGSYCCLDLCYHDRTPGLQAVLCMFSTGSIPFSFYWHQSASSSCFLCTSMKQKTPGKKLELLDENTWGRRFTFTLWGRDRRETRRLNKSIYMKSLVIFKKSKNMLPQDLHLLFHGVLANKKFSPPTAVSQTMSHYTGYCTQI